MPEIRDGDTTPDDHTPEGTTPDVASTGKLGPEAEDSARTEAATAREPLISGDPLGLGGTTDPDAPSRRPQPKIVSLLGEFFRMSRTTAILLVAFVLLGILYSMVKTDPVVNVRPPGAPITAEEPAPAEGTTPVEESPTPETTIDQTTVPTATPQTSPPVTGTTPPPGRQTPASPTGATGQQAPPQQSPQEQSPQEQAQQGEDSGDAGAGGNPVTTS
ncbi:hypothetical protein G6027_17890 [Dietzia sp. SLG310A2-38A2]|uniref:hypothetical protein n=1 Tax=Dietzia sp. SLG310A2-38A2 TaxID=1630643 RepID=UPI0015FAA26B|nr:hypothetical protein [Dietzia sp. SLG310A2-38A2]MBB1032701.1 hypothetical protein [Dietzia sp. SLG310A2-38A2]